LADLLRHCRKSLEQGLQPQLPWPLPEFQPPGIAPQSSPSAGETRAINSLSSQGGVRGRSRRLLHLIAVSLLLFAATLGVTEATGVTRLAATVIRLTTGEGTLIIETDDPELSIAIDGQELSISGAGLKELKLRPGSYTVVASKNGAPVKQELVQIARNGRQVLRVSLERTGAATAGRTSTTQAGWYGWPADAPKPAIAPFDAAQARRHQEEWAKYLQIDVEYTNTLGMQFVLIPPGEFTMGSTAAEIEAALKDVSPDDKHWQRSCKSAAPQHKVILTQPIYLGVNEVTQAEYEKVMGANPSHFAPMGLGKEAVAGMEMADHPVESVSWNDAAEFCAKLSQLEKFKPFYFRAGETITPLDGTGYRLPSEAEWEFACRAGTAAKYWIGDQQEDLMQAGWFTGNSGERTHAARELKANPYGLYDIHGNVWEWVQDGWEPTFYGQFQEKPAINPSVPFHALPQRVLRGGGWGYAASACRSSNRGTHLPTQLGSLLGFRVSLVALGPRVGRP
jgi:formylglycine-generating enzyme required for sulfatase activity